MYVVLRHAADSSQRDRAARFWQASAFTSNQVMQNSRSVTSLFNMKTANVRQLRHDFGSIMD